MRLQVRAVSALALDLGAVILVFQNSLLEGLLNHDSLACALATFGQVSESSFLLRKQTWGGRRCALWLFGLLSLEVFLNEHIGFGIL